MKIEQLTRDCVKNLKAYSSARDEFKDFEKEMIFLDANENPHENGVNRYPDPKQTSVKKKLAKLKGVKETQILLGNGSDEILDIIFRTFCEPKEDNVITLPPTYGMYKVLADLNNVKNKEVLLTSDFQPSVKEILDNTDKNSKILFLCTPNNPTGNSIDGKSIEVLLNTFPGIVVIDEAYIDFSEQKSWISKLDDFPNLIVTQTFSKAYAMAGVRLGICYASEDIIEIFNRIKPPYNVNILTQRCALKRFDKLEMVEDEVKKILKERKRLIAGLEDIKFVKKIFPTDANFVLIRVDDANNIYKQLIAKGIVIRNRTTQPLCENTIRITVGTKKENKILLKALKEI